MITPTTSKYKRLAALFKKILDATNCAEQESNFILKITLQI